MTDQCYQNHDILTHQKPLITNRLTSLIHAVESINSIGNNMESEKDFTTRFKF